jgi:hypothetical protein
MNTDSGPATETITPALQPLPPPDSHSIPLNPPKSPLFPPNIFARRQNGELRGSFPPAGGVAPTRAKCARAAKLD